MQKRSSIIGIILGVGVIPTAWATSKVSSPNVEKGKLEFEYRGGYDTDDLVTKDDKQLHKLVVNYGLTESLRPEVKAVIAKNPDHDAKITGIETSLRWQFFEPDEFFAAMALEGNFTASTQPNKTDKLGIKWLAEKKFDHWVHVVNLSLEEEVGEHSENGASLKLAWRSHYKVTSYFMPGIEYYGDTGKLRDHEPYENQAHQLGPVIHGKLGEHVKYEAGYLFGISDSATDGTAKLLVSYSMKF